MNPSCYSLSAYIRSSVPAIISYCKYDTVIGSTRIAEKDCVALRVGKEDVLLKYGNIVCSEPLVLAKHAH